MLNESMIDNDLALIKNIGKLPEDYSPLNFNDVLQVAPNEIENVYVAGFSYSRVEFPRWGLGTLRYAEIPVLKFNHSSKIVVLDQTNGKGTCQGDSGGGAFVYQNYQWIQIGVASFVDIKDGNPKKVDCRKTSSYFSLIFYLPWIESHLINI